MNKYLYSLLLLTALSSQLQSMSGGQEQLGIAQEKTFNDPNFHYCFEEYIINNKDNSRLAVDKVNAFFLNYDTNYVQLIMDDDLTSPLLFAVEANNLSVANFILEHPNFLNLPHVANNVQTALKHAETYKRLEKKLKDLVQDPQLPDRDQIIERLQQAAARLQEERALEDRFDQE